MKHLRLARTNSTKGTFLWCKLVLDIKLLYWDEQLQFVLLSQNKREHKAKSRSRTMISDSEIPCLDSWHHCTPGVSVMIGEKNEMHLTSFLTVIPGLTMLFIFSFEKVAVILLNCVLYVFV